MKIYKKTASNVTVLLTLFSHTANVDKIYASNEEFCSEYIPNQHRQITCEWWIANTLTLFFEYPQHGHGYWVWASKSTKYDKTWKPQKCECIYGTEKDEKWNVTKKIFVGILLDDWLWKDKNTTKK